LYSRMEYKSVKLILDDSTLDLPIITGTDGSQSIDIEDLFENTGLHTYDPRLKNTTCLKSSISWIDREHGTLLYRGYDVEELVQNSTFIETSYLLRHGELPVADELTKYSNSLSNHSMIHEDMRNIFDAFPSGAHPLAILATMVSTLSSYYPQTYEENFARGIDIGTGLLSKVRTLAAWSYKKSIGEPIVYPSDKLPYWHNFMNMMFSIPSEPYSCPEENIKIMNQIMILYSDHEQNVGTTAVRLVGSTKANLYACIISGMSAMWGVRESGANIPPMIMVEIMLNQNQAPEVFFEKFIKGHEPLRSNGLGNSSYKTIDPRAKISKELFHEYRKTHKHADNDPYIQKALEIEEFVLGHPYFLEKGLYPNLDFYSAMIFHLLGIPLTMNNVIRVIGKLSGWLAHWHEQRLNVNLSYRPAQVYTGELKRTYIPLERRNSNDI